MLSDSKARLSKFQAVPKASGSDEDKVINTGFALRRKGEPAWQCTTTHRRKTGMEWALLKERAEKVKFVKEESWAEEG
jgi:hypothetical protein